MEMFLQFGWQMNNLCVELLSRWNGGTVIFSPKDLSNASLLRIAGSVTGINNGQCLFDPQFYMPHSQHTRLNKHDYWPKKYSTNAFFNSGSISTLLSKLYGLNKQMNCSEMILPGLFATAIDDTWLQVHSLIAQEAKSIVTDMPLIQTVALSGDVTRDEAQVGTLLESITKWDVDGYYVVCEHPKGSYLVDDPMWLANVLDIVAGLKLSKKTKVVLGYCSHQMLIATCAKVDAISSGTWLNVRSFPSDKFNSTATDSTVKQRAKWYYCPRALSEYRVPYLDIARTLGILPQMAPSQSMMNEFVTHLFSGAQPSTVGLSEPDSFKHYLVCLKSQADASALGTFDDTLTTYRALLDRAETLLNTLSSNTIRGEQRDFSGIININRSALTILERTRGPLLRRKWNAI